MLHSLRKFFTTFEVSKIPITSLYSEHIFILSLMKISKTRELNNVIPFINFQKSLLTVPLFS